MDSSQTGHGLKCRRSSWNVSGLSPRVQTDARAVPKSRFCEGLLGILIRLLGRIPNVDEYGDEQKIN
eukprot:8474107-Lingulodinium_polyedra.AAC.1